MLNKAILAILLLLPAPIFATEQVYQEMQAYCKASPQGCAGRLYGCYMINAEIITELKRSYRQVRRLQKKLNKKNP